MHEIQHRLELHPSFIPDIEQAFKDVFVEVDESLKSQPSIDCMYSGTTAVAVLMRGSRLTIANAGDSRAVMAVKNRDGMIVAKDLSIDQNPNNPMEQARIEAAGGFVSPPPELGLSARVWLDADFTQIGLAMGRSIGDHAVSPVGVIAEPEVTFYDITGERGGEERRLERSNIKSSDRRPT
jgi:serine/threonine protein phosphatase PrpC